MLAGAEVAIDVRDDERPGFGPRVALYLAAGLLLLSEPLHPPSGLRPGEDHLEFRSSAELVELLGRAAPIRARFTRSASRAGSARETFRASRVLPELLAPFASGPDASR